MVFQFIGIQIFSALYLILILVVYSSKKRYESVENDIFKILLTFTIFEIVVDIITNYSIKYANTFLIFNNLMCRISLINYQIWTAFLMLYVLFLGNRYNYKSLEELFKKNFKFKMGIAVVAFFAIITIFLPMSFVYSSKYQISYITGISTTYTYAISVAYLLIVLITVLVNKNKIPFTKRLPIFLFILMSAIFLPIQKCIEDVPVLTVPLMAFAIMVMYFTLENPDLKLINELNDLKSDAENSSNDKTRFLDNIASNLKKPINSIYGFSQILLTENLSTKARSDAEKIVMSSRSLLEMINNTFDVSKIETDLISINNVDYELKDMLSRIKVIAINSVDNDKVKFYIKVNGNVPNKLHGDNDKIFKVLSNLLSNSIKYTQVGKIVLEVSASIQDNDAIIKFKLSDTGIGIKEENAQDIFTKFERVEDSNIIEGTGLGLALCKKITELLDGKIDFESTYGAGTKFYFEVKQQITNKENMLPQDITLYKEGHLNLFNASGKKVLIIDDNQNNNEVLKRMSSLYNMNFFFALSSDECINLLKKYEDYGLIFLDSKLLNDNIIKMIKTYKHINKVKNLKIIIMSDDSFISSRNYYINAGFDEYIEKPIDLGRLDEILNKYLF